MKDERRAPQTRTPVSPEEVGFWAAPPPPSAGEGGGGGPPAGNVIGWVREQVALGTPLRFRVTSESMAPLLLPGDEVIVAAAPPETLRPGDVIVAAAPGRPFVVHRLVALRREGDGFWLVTRGDRSGTPDPAWTAEAIVGRVVAVVRAGQMLDLRRGRGRVLTLTQGTLARLEAATYGLLRGAAYALLGRRMPRLGRVVRTPFRALAELISQGLKLGS